jgi:glycosyltransferase involved in cell wall biosynthesis
LKVLIVHNTYQSQGGEDSVVDAEITMLRSHGHEVATYFRNNDDISTQPASSVAIQTLWSSRSARDLAQLIQSFKPDVIHAHNTMPLISPSIYWAAARSRVPVVQTLHNFRLMCLSALYLREGKVCEDCSGHLPWRGVVRTCYRDSTAASAVLAGMLTLHRGLGTYRNKVSRYIALNNFCRNKFIEGGLPAERIVVKPNFVDAPLPLEQLRNGFLFVGRLSLEKGISCLAEAVKLLPEVQVSVAGVGSEEVLVNGSQSFKLLGKLSSESVLAEMNRSIAMLVPSIWYETFGMVVIEAFACSTPVIASRIGALAEIVTDGETGLLFEAGNAHDMANKMSWALAHPEKMAEMGRNARTKYEAEFTAEKNYMQLMAIYEDVIQEQQNAR